MTARRSLLAIAAVFAFASACAAADASDPAIEKIKESLPMAFWGMPRTPATKACPIRSLNRRQPDRSLAVDLKSAELVLTGFSEDGKCVEVSVPPAKGSSTRCKRWFKVDDVLFTGGKKPSPAGASAKTAMFIYSPYGSKRPTLLGCVPEGTAYVDFGPRKAGKETFTLALVEGGGATADGESYASRLVYARERLPVADESNYYDRVANLIAEEPYQPGLHWDNSTHPLLVKNGNGGCAAFVTDFAKYVFDAGNFNQGERFEDPAEIRAGDVLALKGHFIAVLSRDGDKLYIMDGNCNSAIRRSASAFSVVKGAWCNGGVPHPDDFLHGFHYLKSPPDPKLAKKLPK